MPRLPQLATSCCGCSLETGTRMIAWLEVFGGTLVVIAMLLLATGVIPMKVEGKEENEIYAMGLAGIIMVIIIYVAAIIMGIILLIGVTKKRLSNVRIWVMVKSVLIVLYILYYVVLILIWLFAAGSPVTLEIIPLLLEIYFLMVVYSYYREQKGTSGAV